MFDVTVKESFFHIKDWLHEAQMEIGEQVPFILVGNKIDLKSKRKIKLKEMQLFQENHKNIVMIYETSAKTSKNIKELFGSIAETIQKGAVTRNNKSSVSRSSPKNQISDRKKIASARPLPTSLKKK